jgi:KDO2-lipid IV(A) lauroyltransferase
MARHALWGIALIRALPACLAYRLGDVLGLVLAAITLVRDPRVARKGRGVTRNQKIVYREKWTKRLGRRLLLQWARHMAHLVIDACRMPSINRFNLHDHVDLAGLKNVLTLLREGKGVICVGGHIGMFELLGHSASLCDVPVTFVARPLPIPEVDAVVRDIRGRGGVQVLSKWNVLSALKRALKDGRVVGIAADENTRKNGVFQPFLGTLAATTRTPAILQRVTGAPIAVVSIHRTGRERFRWDCWDVIRAERTSDKKADVERVMRRVSDALSRAILAEPAQWFWGSRRYSTRPPGEVPGADGLPPRVQAEHLVTLQAEASPAAAVS